jgi:cAMP-dependent protein kinase regulator
MEQWLKSKGRKVQAEAQKRQGNKLDGLSSSGTSDSDEEELVIPKPNKKLTARTSVSAEAFGMWNKKDDFVPKFVQKSQQARDRITARLGQSFMFANLDDKEKDVVIGAMEEVHFNPKDKVITQGEDGDVLYVVDKGLLDCHKVFAQGAEATYLKTYVPGESFGELALLYNAPRAASIVCKESAICFTLDRACFNHIVKDASIRRRNRYEEFLNKVPILQSLDSYERGKISDSLVTQKFKEGDYVIREGEFGSTFFLIESGQAEALKRTTNGGENVVYQYKEHDYFGELSLLRDEPRAASIKATVSVFFVVFVLLEIECASSGEHR